MHARVRTGESTDKHDLVNSVIIYLQKHFKNATSLVTLTEQFQPVLFTYILQVGSHTGPTVLHAICVHLTKARFSDLCKPLSHGRRHQVIVEKNE